MSSDYTGIALVIGSIFAGLTSLGTLLTVYLKSLRDEKQHVLDREQDAIDREEAKKGLEVTASKVEEVAKKLQNSTSDTDAKLKDLKQTGDSTHVLVNSNMAAQLKISSIALRRLSELTNHPDDSAAAELAETLYRAHLGKQDEVNGKTK